MNICRTVLLLLMASVVLAGQAAPDAQQKRMEQMERRILLLEERIRQLEGKDAPEPDAQAAVEPKTQASVEQETPAAARSQAVPPEEPASPEPAPPTLTATGGQPSDVQVKLPSMEDIESPETRLPVSGYMDFHFNKVQNEGSQLDFHRFVLLFGHSFTDRIQFWSELEIEHAFVSGEGELGELEVEQAFLDFLVKPWLNFRGGMLLAPVGIQNERHEPPSYQGVERTFVDTFILPTTWFDSGAGIFGDLGHGFVYKAYVMSPLDATLFDAGEGLRGGRQKGFQSVTQNAAYTGRLEYHGMPGLALGGSFWTGNTGFNVPGINPRVRVLEFDGRYGVSRFDLRGQFADVDISQTSQLNTFLQRGAGVNPNIARNLRGFYWETGYHLRPRHLPHDVVAFFRYENFDTQRKMAPGFLPLRQFDRQAWVLGATYYPEPDIALKFDYSILRNRSSIIQPHNSLNLGLGWWF